MAEMIPADFRRKMGALLGGESDAFFAALEVESSGLRVNTLRASPAEALERIPFALQPLPQLPEGFLLGPDVRAGRHPYHHAGLYYLQDPAAMLVGALVAPRPGERVADLSAAPGGKATHLAARMEDAGFLLANDPHPTRARELAGNLERCGVRSAAVTIESVERLAERLEGWFDRVLLDAPCSGEAMFHKSAAARQDWSESTVSGCARRQEELLGSAARLVRPGGLLAYSTCTFSPEEDERVIALFLRANPTFEVEAPPPVEGGADGRPDWVESGLSRPDLSRTLRLWPHRVPGAGHYVALLRRTGESWPREHRAAAADRSSVAPDSLAASLIDHLPGARLQGVILRGSELFAVPADAPPLDGLRALRPGWWLGTQHGERFAPSHALAMAAREEEVRQVLDLELSDPRVAAYLRGETISSEGTAGWLVVRVEGLPLGWGKRVGSTVKNHLPKGLRTLG
jgi:16S rRNA C967 or C1407 C5-methylase (RsmB/RsmF family)/NOL1/NOP2/fmu family ribosome biogenesis protein